MFVTYESGHHDSWSDYGHKPWQEGYENKHRQDHEWVTMQKFKAEWSATYGPEYRGVIPNLTTENGPARTHMGDDYHAAECQRDRELRSRPGERARRRRLRR